MSYITFQCYACSKNLKVPAEKAGRKAKCNQCGTVLTIPAQSGETENPPSSSGSGQHSRLPATGPTGQTAVDPATAVHYPQPAPEQPFEPTEVAYVPAPATGVYPQPSAGGVGPAMPGSYPPPGGGYAPYPGESGEYPSEEYTDVSKRPKWHMVRLGMLLCFIGSCVMAGAYALHVIGYLLVTIPTVSGTGSLSSLDTARVLLLISMLISLFATITAIVGYVFCMIGPNKRGSMGLSIAVISVAVLELLLIMVFQLPGMFGQGWFTMGTSQSFFGTWFLLLLIQLLFGAEVILFTLVVRAFALSLKKKMHAKSAMVSLFLASAYTGERLLTFIFWLVATNMTNPDARRVFGWINIILLWLGIFVFIAFIIIYTIFLFKSWKIIPEKKLSPS